MRESHALGDPVLVYDNPHTAARAEAGEPGIPGRLGRVVEDVTPHGSKWSPFGDPERRGGAYVDSGPEGPATYLVRCVDGSLARADVHCLRTPSEVAAAIRQRAAGAEARAAFAQTEAAQHRAEAASLRAAAQAIHEQETSQEETSEAIKR